METTTARVEPNPFLWHELLTTDVKAAIDFYTDVVGWKTQAYDFEGSEGPDYTMWVAGDTPVGGGMTIDMAMMGDMPPHWAAYVQTSDVDKTLRRVKELGGSPLGDPMDIPTVGRMAGFADPQGATIWALQPAGSEPMPEPPAEGSFTWNELATTDSAAAFEFYQNLFGWEKLDDMDLGDGWMYRVFGNGEEMYGGIYNKPPDMPMPPHWLYYVNVSDLDAALERVRERGGQVLNGPMDVPGGDRIGQCLDPQGAAFALHETKK